MLALLARGDVLDFGGRLQRRFIECGGDLLAPCSFEIARKRRNARLRDTALGVIGSERMRRV